MLSLFISHIRARRVLPKSLAPKIYLALYENAFIKCTKFAVARRNRRITKIGRITVLPGCTPWPDELARRYRAKGYWGDLSIPRLFDEMAAEAPDRIAVIEGDA